MRGELWVVATLVVAGCASAQQRWLQPNERLTATGEVVEFPLPHPASGPTTIALAADGTVWFTESNGNRIGRMNPDGTGVTELTFGAQASGGPAWLPDGSKIAFLSDVTGDSRLYKMNPDGTGQEPLTPELENTWVQGAAWRP